MNDFVVKSVAFCSSLSNEEREVFQAVSKRLGTTPNHYYSINDAIIYVSEELSLDKGYVAMVITKPNMVCWAWANIVDKLYNLAAVKQEKLDSILEYLGTVSKDTDKETVLSKVLSMIIH